MATRTRLSATLYVRGLSCEFILFSIIFVSLCCSYNRRLCCWICTLINSYWSELNWAVLWGLAIYLHAGRNSRVIANTLTRKFRLCRRRFAQFAWKGHVEWRNWRPVFVTDPASLAFYFYPVDGDIAMLRNVIMFRMLCFICHCIRYRLNNNNNNNNNNKVFSEFITI